MFKQGMRAAGALLLAGALSLGVAGGTAFADDTDGSGSSHHPSGKDRTEEKGGSGTQGKSTSDPDGTSNGGEDKPGKGGGSHRGDQDGNNGCGNDQDFEDDNNGNCRGKRRGGDVGGSEKRTDDKRNDDKRNDDKRNDDKRREESKKTCPSGQEMQRGTCVASQGEERDDDDTTCPTGQRMVGSTCVANDEKKRDGSGGTRDNTKDTGTDSDADTGNGSDDEGGVGGENDAVGGEDDGVAGGEDGGAGDLAPARTEVLGVTLERPAPGQGAGNAAVSGARASRSGGAQVLGAQFQRNAAPATLARTGLQTVLLVAFGLGLLSAGMVLTRKRAAQG